MNAKSVLWCALAVFCIQASLAWSNPIYKTVKMWPANLNSPLGKPTAKSEFLTAIACVDARNGQYTNCTYDIRINGLTQPDTDVANNGGHLPDKHSATHPVGDLQMIYPTTSQKSQLLSGQTKNGIVYISHEMPEVSGRIETIFNLYVQPGWYTVYPESCNGNRASWCFYTTLDVGVAATLLPLPDPNSNPNVSYPYIRVRNPTISVNNIQIPDPHPDSVAFYGTIDTLFFLNNIAISYRDAGFQLSVNDMSLPRGGKFDIYGDYKLTPPDAGHSFHRTGLSADINKDSNGDCLENQELLNVVDQEMPIKAVSPFATRYFPSRFLCETWNHNNIHIDFDGMVF